MHRFFYRNFSDDWDVFFRALCGLLLGFGAAWFIWQLMPRDIYRDFVRLCLSAYPGFWRTVLWNCIPLVMAAGLAAFASPKFAAFVSSALFGLLISFCSFSVGSTGKRFTFSVLISLQTCLAMLFVYAFLFKVTPKRLIPVFVFAIIATILWTMILYHLISPSVLLLIDRYLI